MDPPTYSTERCTPDSILLNLCPLPNASSYLVGTLGFGSASVQGEVQLKISNPTTNNQTDSQPYDKLVVELVGTETQSGVLPIVILDERVVVWEATPAQSSTSTNQSPPSLPPTTSFNFNLTNDLPHCIHRPDGSLEYFLSATLTGPGVASLTRRSPIHLSRSSNPSIHLNSQTPAELLLSDPVKATVQLAKTTFRRSELIGLVATIDVPSDKAVQHDNVRLRTVSAELVRKISVTGTRETLERPSLSTQLSETSRGKESAERDWDDPAQASSSQPSPLELTSPLDLPGTGTPTEPGPSHETVLSRSGKSCRFSPNRPIVLKLLLHPPSSFACESITQLTTLHQISFEVRVNVGLVDTETSTRQECILSQVVTILPDWPAPSAVAAEKQREVRASAADDDEGGVPTYDESSSDPVSSFARTTYIGDMEPPPGWDEEEYDGYEELSARASAVPPPPTIDEDVSPPSAADADADAADSAGPSGAEVLLAGMGHLRLADQPAPSSVHTSPAIDEGGGSSAEDCPEPSPPSPLSALAPALPPSFVSSTSVPGPLSASNVPHGLPPPYAGDGPPSYASSQPGQLVGVTDQGLLYTLRP